MDNQTVTTNYSVLPFYQVIVFSFIATLLCLATTFGNLLVMISICIESRLKTISNYYLLSLAVADLLIGVISMPLYTTFLIMQYWPFSATICDLWLSLDYTVSNASVANLLIISYDRYKTITCPLTYRVKRSPKKTGIIILVAWIISALLWTPFIYIWPFIDGKRTVPSDQCYIQFIESSRLITLLTASIAYFIPLFIIMIFTLQIYMVTRRRNKYLHTLGCGARVPSGSTIVTNQENMINSSSEIKDSGNGQTTKMNKHGSQSLSGSLILTPKTLQTSSGTSNSSPASNQHGIVANQINRRSLKKKPSSNKAAKTLAAIIIAFFVTWFPYNLFTVINVFSASKSNPTIGATLYSLGYYLCYINSTMNPILYAYCNILFRQTFWRIIICGRSKTNKKFFSCMPTTVSSN